MDVWRATAHAMEGEEPMIGPIHNKGARSGGTNGWTMATALIWYKQRQNAKARKTAPVGGSADTDDAHGEGNGVVVFDVETTHLIEDETPIRDMEISVACATWIPPGTRTPSEAAEKAEHMSAWHGTVTRAPQGGGVVRIEQLLRWFDGARAIVGYNARAFDMQVLRRYYEGDDARWHAHVRKLCDPMEQIQRVTGRRQRMQAVLKINKLAGKDGAGTDAPRWWEEGKLARLETYCERDVAGLVEIVMRDEIHLPGKQTTREVSVVRLLQQQQQAGESTRRQAADGEERADGGARIFPAPPEPRNERAAREKRSADEMGNLEGAQDHSGRTSRHEATRKKQKTQWTAHADEDAEGARQRGAHRQLGGAAAQGAEREDDAAGGDGRRDANGLHAAARQTDGSQRTAVNDRTFRKRTMQAYDEVERRGPRVAAADRPVYLERVTRRGGCKRRAIVMGATAIEHVVRGQYEWRDGDLRRTAGGAGRKRYWDGATK